MKSVFALRASLAIAGLVAALVPACSSKTAATAAACDPKQCAPGNTCILIEGETKCHRPCSTNFAADPTTNCPAGATCVAANDPATIPPTCTKASQATTAKLCAGYNAAGAKLTAYACGDTVPHGCIATSDATQVCCDDSPAATFPQPICVKQFGAVPPAAKQWGTLCNAANGLDNNPDCDSSNGFSCYGTGPADGAAYCTRYSCNVDRECAPGYYCGAINVAPNVLTAKPTIHQTTTACIRRDYCAPCKADLDCPSLNGIAQHCVPDDNYVGFCSPECVDNKNCNFEARCVDGGIGIKTCYPRAGTCVGDGSLCSPCRSDIDCGDDGVCVRGQYTTERACAKKSGIVCGKGQVQGTDFQCPSASSPKTTVACRGDAFEQVPLNYCHGLYKFGDGADVGCWTPAR
jgi:hypothetical protein